jgi:FMN phosphatase YigB (HAD superfamily)
MERKITRIEIFDFDGTLIDTPLPDDGKLQWILKTGLEWPHKGWWGKRESLRLDVFDMPVIQEVIDAYDKVKDDDSVLKVMMTGRMQGLSREVEMILEENNLVFDEYHYNTGGDTFTCKTRTTEDLVKRYIGVTHVQMYDDRVLHIEGFKKLGEKLISEGLKSFNITLVPIKKDTI